MSKNSFTKKLFPFLALFLLLIVLGSIVFVRFIRPYEEQSRQDYPTILNPGTQLGIVTRPDPGEIVRGHLLELPAFDPKTVNPWQIDIRGTDVSRIDAQRDLESLLYATFDDQTHWPQSLPDNFSPSRIMELGRNPGLGIRRLHSQGITGKGVGLAIIDQTLLVEHIEFKENLKLFEEIHSAGHQASMHAPAVASIAVGKTVGVAPDADLYFISETHGRYKGREFTWDFSYLAKAIERIIEINRSLPKDRKIRVLSISVGWTPKRKGYKAVVSIVKKAIKEGIFVVSTSIHDSYGPNFRFDGLGRLPNLDPEQSASYSPGLFRIAGLLNGTQKEIDENTLLVPMDSRCTASPGGNENYVFYRSGGWSWSVPYIAGLYALACQARPSITPEIFWKTALSTGMPLDYEISGKNFHMGKIVDPGKLISTLAR